MASSGLIWHILRSPLFVNNLEVPELRSHARITDEASGIRDLRESGGMADAPDLGFILGMQLSS